MTAPVTGIVAAMLEGLRRTAGAWRPLVLAHVLNLVLAGLLAAVVFDAIAASLGASLAGGRMRESFDPLWYQSFSAQASGVAASFRPSVSGAGGVLDGLEAFADGFLALVFGPSHGILPLMVVYLVAWSTLSGGFIARFSGRGGFAEAVRRHWAGLLLVTLAGVAGAVVVFGPLRASLDGWAEAALREEIDERVRAAWIAGQYIVLWAIVGSVRLVLDYAKVAVVLRERGGSVAAVPRAVASAARFVLRHPLRTAGLHVLLGTVWLASLGAYAVAVPGAGVSSQGAVVATLLLGQAYVFSRVFLRGWFLAGTTVTWLALEPRTVPAEPLAPAADASPER